MIICSEKHTNIPFRNRYMTLQMMTKATKLCVSTTMESNETILLSLTEIERRLHALEVLVAGPFLESSTSAPVVETMNSVKEKLSNVEKENTVLSSFDRMVEQISPLLSDSEVAISSDTKKAIILSSEDFITNISKQLQVIEACSKFANAVNLQDFPQAKKRISNLEPLHFDCMEKVLQQNRDFEALITRYNDITYLLSEKFAFWDELLSSWEQLMNR